ncbi:MAG: type VI secretion system tube protein Hcp [Bacteroidetes bacterium]|nr:type VI secretion system tube protein Hcp [Bacteroidota bacterium]
MPTPFALRMLLLLLLACPVLNAQIDGAVRRNLVANMEQDAGMYLLIKDASGRLVPGNLSAKEKPGHITISGFTQTSEAAQEGKAVSLGQVRITKSVGESTAVLLEALSEGQVLKQVDVLVYKKKSDGTEIEEFRLKLEDVTVVSVQTRFKAGNSRIPNSTLVEEEVVLDYRAITWLLDDGTSSFRAEQ